MLVITTQRDTIPPLDRARLYADAELYDEARDNVRSALAGLADLVALARNNPHRLGKAGRVADDCADTLRRLEATLSNELHRVEAAMEVSR